MTRGAKNGELKTQSLYERYVLPNYGRFPLCLSEGEGAVVRDEGGREYLDFAAGVAVNSLGHCHPAMTAAIHAQVERMIHCSNLYHIREQALLAEHLAEKVVGAAGKSFFCNSGAEANEGLIKLARKYGQAVPRAGGAPRFEIITFENSFHGRTMGGISATGQSKVKDGFAPLLPGFVHLPFNDLEALRKAVGPDTVAILLEAVQGEGGINVATPEFLAGAAALCKEHGLLLMMDEVQCGIGRTGDLCGWKSIEGGEAIEPDAVSWAKGIAGGFPMGAIWIRDREVNGSGPLCDLLGPGTHGATFGGNPLASAVALAVLEEIQEFKLWENAKMQGEYLVEQIRSWGCDVVGEVRGRGLMIGIEIDSGELEKISDFDASAGTASLHVVNALMEEGLLTVGAGANVVRLLPPLNLKREDADKALAILKAVLLGKTERVEK